MLDGVYPPDIDFDVDIALSARRALGELHNACAESEVCSRRVGDLRAGVNGLIERLNADPVKVSLGAHDTRLGEAVDVMIDGDGLAGLLFVVMYSHEAAAFMAPIMLELQSEVEGVGAVIARFAVEYSLSLLDENYEGTYFATTCADRLPFTSGVAEDMGPFEAAVAGSGLGEYCAPWDVPASPQIAASPVASDLPVLLLSGQLDPIAPPEYAERAAEHLPNATLVERKGHSHGTWIADNDCIAGIVADFLGRPEETPDIGCADEPSPLQWQPSTPSWLMN